MLRIICSMIIITISVSSAAAETVRIQSDWKRDRYLNIESGRLRASAIEPASHSAMWVLEKDGDSGRYSSRYRIKNFWKPDQYVHMKRGRLAAGTIDRGWLSALWTLEPVDGTTAYLLRSVWKPDWYIHLEDGALVVDTIEDDGHSARWNVITTKVVEDPETCLTWAYEVFAPGDRKFARHWAKDACKVIGSLRVAQLLFSQLSHRLPTGAALREASRLATADLESKYDVLSYTLEKYLQKESPYAATIIAVDQVKTIAPTALACLKREFEENKKAMYFALKACR